MSPRILFVAALFLVPMASRAAESSSVAVAVKIDIPQTTSWDSKTVYPRRLGNRYPDDDLFSVVLENISSKTIFLRGQDWDALSFEAIDDGGRKTVIRHVPELTNGKPMANVRLDPGEATVRIIHYAQPAEWEPFPFSHDPHKTDTARRVILRAIYEPSAPANGANVDYWAGTAKSKPVEVLLEDNALRQTERSGQTVTDGIGMSLSVLTTNRETDFEAAFKNQTTNDVCLNLGEMLANGKVQIPDKIHFKLKDSSGITWQWTWPQAGVAGRVDDFVVPLRVGSSYTVKVPLSQFLSADYRQHDPMLGSGRYEVSAEFQGTVARNTNLDTQGMTLMNFWTGKLQEGIVTEIR